MYEGSYGRGDRIASLINGGYVPLFRATDDRSWLEVTLHDGRTGWIRNDPQYVTVTPPNPEIVTLCLDPGHGGMDNGAQRYGLAEKHLNFDVAFWKLYPKLSRDGRIGRIWYTRNGDYDVSLRYRWDLANASGCDLFLSVHTNVSPNPDVRGTECYFKCGSEAPNQVRAGSQRAACLITRRVLDTFREFGSINCPPVDRGLICRLLSEEEPVSYYYVLEKTYQPAVLLEMAYLSNRGEAYCLASNTFRSFVAQGIYAGITATLFTDEPGSECSVITRYGL
ncbi:MAG TPA: N-acetylmuramoyl-L-alanine amidase [Symbiobacteriaceae bacterium]|nr:N-acetylmuramoyl-L-alanine amidase [Symbiobacteriaceae bacterium]